MAKRPRPGLPGNPGQGSIEDVVESLTGESDEDLMDRVLSGDPGVDLPDEGPSSPDPDAMDQQAASAMGVGAVAKVHRLAGAKAPASDDDDEPIPPLQLQEVSRTIPLEPTGSERPVQQTRPTAMSEAKEAEEESPEVVDEDADYDKDQTDPEIDRIAQEIADEAEGAPDEDEGDAEAPVQRVAEPTGPKGKPTVRRIRRVSEQASAESEEVESEEPDPEEPVDRRERTVASKQRPRRAARPSRSAPPPTLSDSLDALDDVLGGDDSLGEEVPGEDRETFELRLASQSRTQTPQPLAEKVIIDCYVEGGESWVGSSRKFPLAEWGDAEEVPFDGAEAQRIRTLFYGDLHFVSVAMARHLGVLTETGMRILKRYQKLDEILVAAYFRSKSMEADGAYRVYVAWEDESSAIAIFVRES